MDSPFNGLHYSTRKDSVVKYYCYSTVYSSAVYSSANNCMATADRAVVVFFKEFQWDQRYHPLQFGLIHHSHTINFVLKEVSTISQNLSYKENQ